MIPGARLVVVLAGFLIAGTLTLGDVLTWSRLSARERWIAGVCRVTLRGLALSLALLGLLGLIAGRAALVGYDLDCCLLRLPPEARAPALDWTGDWLLYCVGLVIGVLALPRLSAATGGWFVAFAEVAGLVILRAALPLSAETARELLVVAVAVAVPGAAVGGAALLRRADRAGPLERRAGQALLVAWLATLLAQAVTAPLWLSDGWPSALMPSLLLLGISGVGALVLVLVGFDGLRPEPGVAEPPSAVSVLGVAVMEQRRTAWLLAGCLLAVGHVAAVGSGAAAKVRDGRRLLARVAEQPELLCWSAEPTVADWEAAADRLEHCATVYLGHRWCGQWLLLEAWIHATRLHNSYQAWLLLTRARDEYGRRKATAPVGWPQGRNVAGTADGALEQLGPRGQPDASIT